MPHVALCLFELASLAMTDPTGKGDFHGDVEAVREANMEDPHRKIYDGRPAVGRPGVIGPAYGGSTLARPGEHVAAARIDAQAQPLRCGLALHDDPRPVPGGRPCGLSRVVEVGVALEQQHLAVVAGGELRDLLDELREARRTVVSKTREIHRLACIAITTPGARCSRAVSNVRFSQAMSAASRSSNSPVRSFVCSSVSSPNQGRRSLLLPTTWTVRTRRPTASM